MDSGTLDAPFQKHGVFTLNFLGRYSLLQRYNVSLAGGLFSACRISNALFCSIKAMSKGTTTLETRKIQG